MGRLKGFLIFAVTTTMLVKADDGWKRLLDLNTAQENRSAQWARSSNIAGENRVPFVPEDIAMPPPWLLPLQQPQMNFPIAQAQVRSFFDEEVVDWPPRSPKTAASLKSHLPEPSQHPKPPPPVIHTTLQPPRRQWTDATIRPVQHLWIEGDQRQSTSQRPATSRTVIKLRDLATPVTQRPVDVKKVEPKSEQTPHQNRQQQTASRKSVISSYDSSEYDYDEGVVISTQIDPHGQQLERDQGFYDSSLTEVDATMSVSGQNDFHAKPVQQQQQPQSRRRQPQTSSSTEDADVEQHQAFDYSKTTNLRTAAVKSVKNSQQPAREPTVHQREKGRPAAAAIYVDEETTHGPLKAKQGHQQQTGVRKEQQQRHQQKSTERNASPTPEVAVFEAERPIFYAQASPNQRQFDVGQHHRQHQPSANNNKQKAAAEWTPKHPPTVELQKQNKNKPRNPERQHHPEEQHQYPSENFPRYKTNNPVVHPVQHEEERQDLQPPYHHRHQPPAPYRPEEVGLSYDQPEEEPRLKEYHRPKEHHHQPIYDYNGKKSQRPRPTETRPAPQFDPQNNNPWLNHQNQPEEISSYDPYDQQNQDPQFHEQEEEEEERRPAHQQQQTEEPLPTAVPFPGGRRPPGGRPPFQSSEQFNGADDNNEKGNNDDEFNSPGPFKAPPPAHRPHHHQLNNNRQRPHRPSHQRPKDASIVTQGLNTLKSLVGLQTSQQRHRPHHSINPNRPGGQRQPGDRRRPPQQQQHAERNSFIDIGGEIGRQDEEISDEFGPSDFNNFPVQTRQNLQSANDEPMEHRSDPEDEIQDIVPPPPVSTTEISPRVTAPPTRPSTEAPELSVSVSSTVATEETKSTLFPPFNKRVRPQPPSPAQTENKANAGKDSSAGQLRITSYKQRIEAMKERAKLREQLALSKKDTEITAELSPISVQSPAVPVSVSTTTTTARPSTTRPKIPPRMPVRRPVTTGPSSSTSSTTETVPLMDKVQEPKDSNYEQYKRRFKPKPSFSRPSQKEEEMAAPPAEDQLPAVKSDAKEEEDPSIRKNLFGKIPGSPFVRRRIQQKQQREDEEELLLLEENSKPPVIVKDSVKEEMPSVPITPFRPNKRIRPGNFGRTTTAPPMVESSLDDEDGAVLASPDQWPPTSEPQAPVKTKMSLIAEEKEEESHQIELASVENKDSSDNHQVEEDRGAETSGQPFLDKPDVSSERMETEEAAAEGDVHQHEKPRHSFFTMATHDPILPIEELLNIRVRDNGKDM